MLIDLRERGRRGGGEAHTNTMTTHGCEKHGWLPPKCTQIGDETHNLGMCPNHELDQQSFGVRDPTF